MAAPEELPFFSGSCIFHFKGMVRSPSAPFNVIHIFKADFTPKMLAYLGFNPIKNCSCIIQEMF